MQKTLVPIDRADKGGEASTIRKADDAATEKERAENIEGNRIRKARNNRRKADGATSPLTRAKSTGRSWKRNGA